MTIYDSPSFKKLKDKWDKKLKASGFEDIEQQDGNLKIWSTTKFELGNSNNRGRNAQEIVDRMKQKRQYFTLAGQFLHSHTFTDKNEKIVWEYHSEGEPSSKISVKIKKLYPRYSDFKLSRLVKSIVDKYKAMMIEQYRTEEDE